MPIPASAGDFCASRAHPPPRSLPQPPPPTTRRRRHSLRWAVPAPGPKLVSCNYSGGFDECSGNNRDRDREVTGGSAGGSEQSGPCCAVDGRTVVGEKVVVSVDYDKGRHRLAVQVSGVGRDRVPAKYRLRAAGSEDWTVSEVVERILRLKHWEDLDGVLNRWAGRFARKNFPLLIRVLRPPHSSQN